VLGDVTDAEQVRVWRETLERRQKIEQRGRASLWQQLRQFFTGKIRQIRRAYVSHVVIAQDPTVRHFHDPFINLVNYIDLLLLCSVVVDPRVDRFMNNFSPLPSVSGRPQQIMSF